MLFSVALQQCLPFTVLKLNCDVTAFIQVHGVATVLTVYGIETFHKSHAGLLNSHELQQYLPLAVLKLDYGMLSPEEFIFRCNSTYRLRY